MRWVIIAVATFLMGMGIMAIPANATDTCTGTWSIGVGGLSIGLGTGQDSAYFTVNQRVGYNTMDPAGGLRELDRLVWKHRDECPTDHLKILGHSEGAAIVHTWVREHQDFENANAILLADPKHENPQGLAYGARWVGGWPGYPLAGTDSDFGSFPVLSVCRYDDIVCNLQTTPVGYVVGHHTWYNFDANAYGDSDEGMVME